MKLPAFQFYPGDWRKDAGVQSLSFHDRGVWFEIMCLLHESEDRGKLILNGQPMPEDALCRILGLDKQILTTTLTTLLTYGVASRCEETGAIMSRRMVRDENLRKIRAEAGKKGGNPVLLKQNPTTGVKQIPTPSSSSSSSSSSSDIPPNPQGGNRERKQKNNLPTSPHAIRIANLFNRRLTTGWSDSEVKAFKSIGQMNDDDLDAIESYYRSERSKGELGKHRRDLKTFLNNYRGELDRALANHTPQQKQPTRVFID